MYNTVSILSHRFSSNANTNIESRRSPWFEGCFGWGLLFRMVFSGPSPRIRVRGLGFSGLGGNLPGFGFEVAGRRRLFDHRIRVGSGRTGHVENR